MEQDCIFQRLLTIGQEEEEEEEKEEEEEAYCYFMVRHLELHGPANSKPPFKIVKKL